MLCTVTAWRPTGVPCPSQSVAANMFCVRKLTLMAEILPTIPTRHRTQNLMWYYRLHWLEKWWPTQKGEDRLQFKINESLLTEIPADTWWLRSWTIHTQPLFSKSYKLFGNGCLLACLLINYFGGSCSIYINLYNSRGTSSMLYNVCDSQCCFSLCFRVTESRLQ